MNERDMILLEAMDDIIAQAPNVGLCPMPFKTIKEEVVRIMGERDGYAFYVHMIKKNAVRTYGVHRL